MNRLGKLLIAATAVAVAIPLAAGSLRPFAGVVQGAAPRAAGHSKTADPTDRTTLRFTITGAHHQHTFSLTRLDGTPVRVEVESIPLNGGYTSPSGVISAVVAKQPNLPNVNWIGTNSNGTNTRGSTETGARVIADYGGGAAQLRVINVASGILAIRSGSTVPKFRETFVVNLWF